MSRKDYTPEQSIGMLRVAEVRLLVWDEHLRRIEANGSASSAAVDHASPELMLATDNFTSLPPSTRNSLATISGVIECTSVTRSLGGIAMGFPVRR